MGALYGSVCYATTTEAANAYFASKEPSYTAGSTSYLSYFDKPASTWLIVRKSISSTGVINNLTSSTAPVPSFSVCDESAAFLDGVEIGWGIATAMVIAWALKLMGKSTR